jgi:hypothetical protein
MGKGGGRAEWGSVAAGRSHPALEVFPTHDFAPCGPPRVDAAAQRALSDQTLAARALGATAARQLDGVPGVTHSRWAGRRGGRPVAGLHTFPWVGWLKFSQGSE